MIDLDGKNNGKFGGRGSRRESREIITKQLPNWFNICTFSTGIFIDHGSKTFCQHDNGIRKSIGLTASAGTYIGDTGCSRTSPRAISRGRGKGVHIFFVGTREYIQLRDPRAHVQHSSCFAANKFRVSPFPSALEFVVLVSRYRRSRECTRVICLPAAVAAAVYEWKTCSHNIII